MSHRQLKWMSHRKKTSIKLYYNNIIPPQCCHFIYTHANTLPYQPLIDNIHITTMFDMIVHKYTVYTLPLTNPLGKSPFTLL